jgi:glycosyltransferase involved in cell wall biosynthesis
MAAAVLATPHPIRERIRAGRGAVRRRVGSGRERLARTAGGWVEALESGGEQRSRRSAAALHLSRTPGRFMNVPWTADAPLVSVVITCFNYGQYVGEALESVARQTWQDLEILVIEGGSTDGTTPQRVRDLQYPKLRKIFQPRPTRVGENRLEGLREARGKFVVFLDADDLLEPTYLEKAVMALELTGADLAYPSVRLFGKENWIWETADRFTLHNLVNGNTIATVAMFRKETWQRLGVGYGTHVTDAIEDWEFWLRFAERGATGVKIREPLMLYRVHGKSFTDASRANQETSRRRVLAEHRPYLSASRVERVSRRQSSSGPCRAAREPPARRSG